MSKINIVMYHYVRNIKESRYPNIKGLEYELFKEQIEWMSKNYRFVTIEDIIGCYETGESLPSNAMLLTFDDGYIDNFTYCLPILKKYHIQGVFYIPGKTFTEKKLLDVNKIHFILACANQEELYQDLITAIIENQEQYQLQSVEALYQKYAVKSRWDKEQTVFIKRMLQTALPEELRNKISSELFEKYVGIEESKFAEELYMNKDQIKYMRDSGMYIGLHGYDHYWLANLSYEKMKEDINKALIAMEGIVDKNNWILNYPYGSYNDEVISYIEQAGCKLSMTTEVGVVDTEKNSRFLLPRLNTNDYPPKSTTYLSFQR